MASLYVFANNVKTSLANSVSSSQTTIQLNSTANFPTIPSGYVWAITLNDAATQSIFEIVYVTNISGAVLTVLRGQEGTTPVAWLANDIAFGAVTAAALGAFLSSASLANFVQLSPATQQTGSINVSGTIKTSGAGQFGGGVAVGGVLSGASTGYFSSEVQANDYVSTVPYANTAIANLGFKFTGSGGVIGVGPSSGISYAGVTASALAIATNASGRGVAIDTAGNLGAYGNLEAGGSVSANGNVAGVNGNFSGTLSAPSVLNGGSQCLTHITSVDGSITPTPNGATVDLSIASSPKILKWYQANGVQQPNPKIVSGSTFCAGGTTAVNLSGSAQFTNSGSYVVITAVAYGAPATTAPAYPQNVSGAQFNLFQANASTCNWIAIGY